MENIIFSSDTGPILLIKMLNMIWKPDTFFLNGQDSYLHTITYANKLFRISYNGDILYSQRLTIKSNCPMVLKKYPMDEQQCPLYIASYGYPPEEVRIMWADVDNPVRKYENITMAQFTLTGISHTNKTVGEEHGNRYSLLILIDLKREIGYYLLQIYLPCYLIVIISWVSFWINREATPARVTLGITTLLTTCTIAITGRVGIPKVAYSTALDIYLLMCFWFVFAALVEYAGVNYFTKTGTGDVSLEEEEDYSQPLEEGESAQIAQALQENDPNKPLLRGTNANTGLSSVRHNVTTDINGHTRISGPSYVSDSCWVMFINCLKGNSKYRYMKSITKTSSVSVSKIDSLARIIFPFSFTCLNIFYWAGFIYYF